MRSLAAEHEAGPQDVDPLLGLALLRAASDPRVMQPEPGRGLAQASVLHGHAPASDNRGPVAVLTGSGVGQSQSAAHQSTLEGAGRGTICSPGLDALTTATQDASSPVVSGGVPPDASQSSLPHDNDLDGTPSHPSLHVNSRGLAVRSARAEVDDPDQINSTQRDLEAGSDIPSPVDDSKDQV